MPGRIIRHNKPIHQRLGNNIIYGEGQDATVVISTTVVMTQDMYYQNLTINSGGTLFTNGFRVFVADTLTVNAGGVIGMPAAIPATVSVGTVYGRGADGSSPKTYVIGDSAAGTQVPEEILNDLENIIQGWNWSVTDGFKRMEGADDGADGADTPGSPGGAGGGGGAGNPGGNAPAGANPTDPLGNPGTAGNPGNPGTSGNPGATGPGGAGGIGGGLVLVVAKNISGTGSIVSQGGAGSAGTSGAAGNAGAAGNPGTGGAAGNPSSTIPGHHTAPTPGNPVPGDPPSDADAPAHSKSQSDPNPYFTASPPNPKPHSAADAKTNPGPANTGTPTSSDAGSKEIPGDPVPCEEPTPGYHWPGGPANGAGYIPQFYVPGPPTWTHCPGAPEPYTYGDATGGGPADPRPTPNSDADPVAGSQNSDPVPTGGGDADPQPVAQSNHADPAHSQNPPLGNPKTGDPVSDPPTPTTNPPVDGAHNPPYTNPGGTAGGAGAGGAAGTAGAAGTGVTGTTGGLGGIIVITDSASPLSTTQVSATYSHLQLST